MFEVSLQSTPLRHTKQENAVNSSFVSWLIKRKAKLRELFIAKEYEMLSHHVERQLFQSTGSSLRVLFIDANYSSNRTDETVLNLCTFATSLERCIIESVISDGAACFLLARNAKLRVLFLNGPGLLYRLGNMNCCENLTDITVVNDNSSESLLNLLNVCSSKLERLSLPQSPIHSAFVFEKLQNCSYLRVLHVIGLRRADLKNVSITSVVELKTFFHTYNTDTLTSIALAFPSLSVLILDSFDSALTTKMVLQLLALFPRLRFLSTWNANFGQIKLSARPPVRSKKVAPCALERLHAIAHTTDFDLVPIMAMCPALFEAMFLSLPTLRAVPQGTAWPLQVLCAHGVSNVTDSNVSNISGLQVLKLWDCFYLTDTGLVALAKINPLLRVLELKNIGDGYGAPSISYKGLLAFLDQCQHLRSVTYLMNLSHNGGSSTRNCFGVDEMLQQMCRKMYSNLQHFQSNIA